MTLFAVTQLLNLLGFAAGAVLYALLLLMTLRYPAREHQHTKIDFLLLVTAILGLLWNAGELTALVAHDFGAIEPAPVLTAISYAALGFLPAVVVHLTVQTSDRQKPDDPRTSWLIVLAYCLSVVAAVFHFQSAAASDGAPSPTGLQILTCGYLFILAALVFSVLRQTTLRKTVLAAALAVFAVSALHLSRPHDGQSWFAIEIIGHQASLPLVLAILYQDYRFAFADLFLKRALFFLFLTLTAFGLYLFAAAPLIKMHETHSAIDLQPTFILLGFWILTALASPVLHKSAVWLVDKILLRRVSYDDLREETARIIQKSATVESVLDQTCQTLATALTAAARWGTIEPPKQSDGFQISAFTNDKNILIPTAEPPFFQIVLSDLSGGRKLLSGELELLENVALLAARRIDALRVTHERCEQQIREQEIGKLISEAELRALRAQLNPHFLFNALTTIGFLIQTAPDKAFATLLELTQLLRGVLRSTGEFSTLGEELKIIESYLNIERARFEERLHVEIKIAAELLKLPVPSLILQPLVENAVKHGITPLKAGGEVCILAKIENENLILIVADSGRGIDKDQLTEKHQRGVGLQNIGARLKSYYGKKAWLEIESNPEGGTRAQICLPMASERVANSVGN